MSKEKLASVPLSLIESVHSQDKTLLLETIQRFVLWNYMNPNLPYSDNDALKLQAEISLMQKVEREKLERKEKELALSKEKELSEYCRKLAEEHLRVFVASEQFRELKDEPADLIREIGWDEPIIDPVTDESYANASPRELLPIDWRRSVDPRENLNGYLEEIRRLYGDDFRLPFSFNRTQSLVDKFKSWFTEGAPKKEPKNSFRFELVLKWKI